MSVSDAAELGSAIGILVATFVMTWVGMRTSRFWLSGYRQIAVGGALAIIIATVLGGFGFADGGPPRFFYAFATYLNATLLWIAVSSLLMERKRVA